MTTSAPWPGIAITIVAIAGMKAAGPLLLGARRLPRRLLVVAGLAAAALLAGLVVVAVGTHGPSRDAAALVGGLGVAGTAYFLRVPMVVAVAVAMLVTALLRWWLGVGA